MKRKINRKEYDFLRQEFSFLQRQGKIDEAGANEMLALYEPKGGANFIRILLVFGAVLVGVGILSFIAGNWAGLTPFFKFGLIVAGMLVSYFAGYKLEDDYERTSRSMYYIGAAIFGAGIFLIGQSFHLQHTVYTDFLLWAVGILPLAYYLKDQLLAVFAGAFLIIYSFSAFSAYDPGSFGPYWLVLLIPVLFWMNETRFDRKGSLFVMNVLLSTSFIGNILELFHAEEWISAAVIFVIGVLLAVFPIKHFHTESVWTGSVIFGITGIMLTFPFIWDNLRFGDSAPHIFAVLFVILLIYLLRKDSLPAILITCALIYRYYTDITYDFMPKSLFFIIGGLLLIGFGFWFEKSRRETVKRHEE
ncbi:hypothetical protein SporoP37_06005 [Sporosarcina sp. P37]|uniref:DUF2157 domain-containing protein n=1 Tax=unclassified Sporosarcina TaxID=2647733 RepID=UPI0009BF0C99|nr:MULTISPECIES: DUF2157 domain-containing protein [unclassified Sporosarcina]ARD47734.1 hypothetical protein SporoP33_05515 [Sporosarcina sp. P33]ARK24266.1 hypothetical protein SporoP37_06005 [Sporosarcina sp. P37]PID18457.1 DUF2157 domain-containing protein [Sporosarcina sp. P35]